MTLKRFATERAYTQADANFIDDENASWKRRFHLARLLRFRPEFAGLSAMAALRKITPLLYTTDGGWDAFCGDEDEDDAIEDFVDQWDRVRFDPTSTPLEMAVEAARRRPLRLPNSVKDKRPVRAGAIDYQFFVAVAVCLAEIVGNGQAVLLPCRELADLLGVPDTRISRWSRWARQDGLLALARPHEYRPGGGGRAAEYRVLVHRERAQ